MTQELRAAIERCYDVFAAYRLQGPGLCVCRCPCCLDEASERALLITPLREIRAGLLGEYTNSAHGWDDTVIAREFRHFLPRYLELIAAYDPPDGLGLDSCLRRMGEAGWLAKWPPGEVAAVLAFFDAFLDASLSALEHRQPGAGGDTFGVDDILACLVRAGGDLERLLAAWDRAGDPGAAVNMASLRQNVVWRQGRPELHGWRDYPGLGAEGGRIAEFLLRPEVDARIEAAFFQTEDEDWQRVLSDALVLRR
jgi:hypothetical protein